MTLKRFRMPALAVVLLLAGPLASARAAPVFLTFSGGSGSPLTVTLAQPVTFIVTTAPSAGILFDLQGVGNFIGGSLNLSGTISYTINGGTPIHINAGNSGTTLGAIHANDFLLFRNPLPGAALGDVVVLSAGSLSTVINIPSAAPSTGSYSAILVDPAGTQVGTALASAPFVITRVARAADDQSLELTWTSQPDAVYRIESTLNLNPESWTVALGNINGASGATTSATVPLTPADRKRFFRVVRQ